MRKLHVVIIFVLVIASAYLINSSVPNRTARQDSFVTKVVDGDTVVVEGGQRVRLLNIDTREKGQNCYQEAKQRMEELVLLKNVTLERDKEDKDQYGRLLRYIYVDGVNINMEMVAEGLAVVYIYDPNTKYQDQFAAIEAQARTEGGCVWTTKP